MSRASPSSKKQHHALKDTDQRAFTSTNTNSNNDSEEISIPIEEEEEEEEEDPQEIPSSENKAGGGGVTSHLYLKSAHPTGILDKQVVLRRIRHRKRVNKARAIISSLFGSTASAAASSGLSSSPNKIRWVDDPFATP